MRLLGLHALSQHFTAQLLGVSEATMSSWMNGKSSPSLSKAIAIADLFQIPTERLMGAQFGDLLENELSSGERFKQVEERITVAVARRSQSDSRLRFVRGSEQSSVGAGRDALPQIVCVPRLFEEERVAVERNARS